jgi:hypothetical protein
MVDIGSNLGAYVFTGKVHYNIPNCTGIDYNTNYIKCCNNISKYLNLKGCSFITGKMHNLKQKYDLVLFLGIIHHLYHRTDDYGSIEAIIEDVAKINNKYLLIEFPDEKDPKASKWTKMPGRITNAQYSHSEFIRVLDLHYRSTAKVGNIGESRHFYLCVK